MNFIITTNLGRELKLNSDTIPVQNRAGVGVNIGLRTTPKMKKDEYVVSVEEGFEDVCNKTDNK